MIDRIIRPRVPQYVRFTVTSLLVASLPTGPTDGSKKKRSLTHPLADLVESYEERILRFRVRFRVRLSRHFGTASDRSQSQEDRSSCPFGLASRVARGTIRV